MHVCVCVCVCVCRVFHEHQRMVDGLLLSDAISNDIQPQEVVEDIADAILSDLLGEEAESEWS